MQNKHFPFWIFTAAVLISLVVPVLIQDGMFMDGMLYVCVAKNLSEGIGTFWHPHFSPQHLVFFDQQPPLGFGIQAIFFNLFGTSIYVERFYSFLTLCLGAFLITRVWQQIFAQETEIKSISWMPVLLWIIVPVCFWSYSNNLLECTMVIFDLLAIYCILKFFEKSFSLYLALAGVFIFLASLTKGFQGLFPLAAIFFYWLVFRKFSFVKMLLYSCQLLSVTALIYIFISLNDSARDGLSAYLQNRVLNSIASVSTVENRFYLIGRLFTELLVPIVLSLLLLILLRKKIKTEKIYSKYYIFFLLIGISASFPLIVTMEQRGFYLVTSLPFYAIALAIISATYTTSALVGVDTKKTGFKIFKVFSIILFCGSIIFSGMQIGKINRDNDMLHDVYLIGNFIPRGTAVNTSPEVWPTWALQEYFIRHFYISMDVNRIPTKEFFIANVPPDDTLYKKINIPTIKYHLYKIIK